MAVWRPAIDTGTGTHGEIRSIPTGDTIATTWLPRYPRSLFVYFDDVTTAGTAGEETLATDSIAAATLSADKDRVDQIFDGIFASNSNEKYIYHYFNGVQRFDSDVLSGTVRAWELRIRIIRYSNTAVRIKYKLTTVSSTGVVSVVSPPSVDIFSLNLTTTAYTTALKGYTPDAAGDLTMNTGSIDFKPGP
jgi:hypothetical protein